MPIHGPQHPKDLHGPGLYQRQQPIEPILRDFNPEIARLGRPLRIIASNGHSRGLSAVDWTGWGILFPEVLCQDWPGVLSVEQAPTVADPGTLYEGKSPWAIITVCDI